MGKALKPAVFLDRDGTINEEMGYLNHESRLILLPGAARAIKRLNQAGWPVVVVSNQSGLARGYFSPELLELIHKRLLELLAREGARLDGWYYCPHHQQGQRPELAIDCDCRKPKPGLFKRAAADLSLDLSASVMVGDRLGDIEAARNIGARAVIVLTGYGRGEVEYELPRRPLKPDFIAAGLPEAVDWILAGLGFEGSGGESLQAVV